jgi:hypothetical protein
MAEADDKDTRPGWAWVLYSKYLEDKLAEVLVLEQADRLGRKEIRERRLRYRYRDRDNNLRYDYWLDRDCNLHYDSLIDKFWREAILDRETSSMVWLVPARFYNHVEPTYEVLGIESERDVRIFRLEVLVPAPPELAETAPKPAEAESAEPSKLVGTTPITDQAAELQKAQRAGRPSSQELVLRKVEERAREHQRRIAQGEPRSQIDGLPEKRNVFLQEVSDWLQKTHSNAKQMKPKTIGDHLRTDERIRALLPEKWFRRR